MVINVISTYHSGRSEYKPFTDQNLYNWLHSNIGGRTKFGGVESLTLQYQLGVL